MTAVAMVVPGSWRRSIYPRRGGIQVPWVPVTGNVPDWSVTRTVLSDPGADADVTAAGLATLDGTPTPLGVAAVGTVLLRDTSLPRFNRQAVADGWITRFGLPFAAAAAVEASDLMVSRRGCPVRRGPEPVPDGECGERYCAGHLSIRRLSVAPNDRGSVVALDTVLARVRTAVAAAPDDVHAAVVEALLPYRTGSLRRRIVTSFLDPAQTRWVDADAAEVARQRRDRQDAELLMAAAHTATQAALIRPWIEDYGGWWSLSSTIMVHTLAEGLGDGLLDIFDRWRERGYGSAAHRRSLLATLAAIPTDRAFEELLRGLDVKGAQEAIETAAGRFPERAMRLLAASADRPRVAELLRRHVARHPELAPEGAAASPAEGPAGTGPLPAVLVTPPWTVRRKAVKPVVLADLRCTDEPAVAWPAGERERLLSWHRTLSPMHDPRELARQVHDGTIDDWVATDLLEDGPEEVVLPLLPVWNPHRLTGVHYWLPRIAARFGLPALPLVLRIARRSPLDGGPHLLPFTAPEVALLVADWLGRLKAARTIALDWLRRHPAAAARALVPAALAKPGVGRRHAGQALLALAAAGHRDPVLAAADAYGPAAGAAIRDLLDTDPLDVLPPRIPAAPVWADPVILPPVRLRDSTDVLPADAVRHLVTMLMLSKPGDPYAGIALVRAACEPSDLARFAWALLQRWEAADAPPAGSWALDAQAVLGDDETAAMLAAAVRVWPYEGAHQRAAAGLDVLAQLGTDAALIQLQDIAAKMKAKAVRARAESKLREVAEALELTADQLADRLVPHLDLAPDATTTLDYGPRRFTVGFDEQLKPYVLDETGARRKDLPDPAASDDARLAPAAQRRFTDMKKVVRKVSTEQVARLERAMATGRQWTGAEFRRTFLRHPLLWPIARRVVWLVAPPPGEAGPAGAGPVGGGSVGGGPVGGGLDGGGPVGGAGAGGVGVAVRLAEDRTLAGVDDQPVALADDAVVSVAHPVHLDVPAWSEVFADYEILQPFRQLARDVHRFTAQEAAATRLERFDGRKALTVKLLALERRGWQRSGQEGGHQSRVERDLPGGALLIVDLDPGIAMGVPTQYPEQVFDDVWICPAGGNQWTRQHAVPFSTLDPATASELLRDLGSCF
ncbi:DUF4132 domain-containing protein [Dactylosporangium aurantiacum]|uniref:DUF4132 domain-containing protein n=1 Tax=Dactylosporangium aurantiacum TaxID=35754 RepID=UPI0012DE1667|nr:DUF4132 domain-containing protein [Dactylosporangium aurantiacum]MDG6108578.1 DUF4132 domain-containing protein [Dactylosporangium aurantiacum]